MKNNPSHIIKVVNTTSDAAKFVVIGHSNVSRFEKNFGVEPNIKITSLVPGVSYAEFLAVTEKQPFQVVKTIIKSTTQGQEIKDKDLSRKGCDVIRRYKSQLDQEICVIHRVEHENPLSKLKFHPIVTIIKNQLIDEYKYLFDGEAKIWFENILGNVEVIIYLYSN